MRLKRLLSLLLVALCSCLTAVADTFIVTSNADAGPGTLREAVIKARSNGTAVIDTITFNLAGNTLSDRTITLLSELPSLNSNIIIDGSTQPGLPLGISTAKVKITVDHNLLVSQFSCFYIESATNVQIFGLYLKYNINPAGGYSPYGIRLMNSSQITIGAPGKGNIISGWFWGVTNSHWSGLTNNANDITIQSNWFSYDENAQLSEYRCIMAINFYNVYNLLVGGDDPAMGNLLIARRSVEAMYRKGPANSDYFTKFINNKVLTNPAGTVSMRQNESGVWLYGDAISDDPNATKVNISNNQFAGDGCDGVKLIGINHKIRIMGNRFGTTIAGTSSLGTAYAIWIHIIQCKKTIIGSDFLQDKNYFSNASYSAIAVDENQNALITKNVFFCNQEGILYYANSSPYIFIKTMTNTLVEGRSDPLAKIELFENHGCSYGNCQGRVYITTVWADANGNWSYAAPNNENIVATATTVDSSTTEFTRPRIDEISSKITHATCGKNNGSITGVKIIEGTHIKWYENNTNTLVGTDTNLVNMPPGTYRLELSLGANGCTIRRYFTINGLTLPSILSTSLTQPGCGAFNGGIYVGNDLSSYRSKWTNELNDSIGTGNFLNNQGPGNYYMQLYFPQDTSCKKTYGPFTLINQSGPNLNTNSIQITPATCSNKNGSITGVNISNVIGTPFIGWYDSTGKFVGSTLDLLAMSAGKYRLKFKDGSPCDTIISPYYTIINNGAIIIDSSQVQIKPSGCQLNNGSIKGIKITGATSIEWINTVSGNIIAATEDISNLPPGNYRLIARNSTYGCQVQTKIYTIINTSPLPLQLLGVTVQEARCSLDNAFISIDAISNNPSYFSFRWLKDSSATVGTGRNLQNIGPGRYQCIATDTNGCQQQIYAHTVVMMPLPTIDESRLVIKADTCNLSVGSVSGITVNSDNPSITYAWYNALNQKIGASQSVQKIPAGSYYLIATDIRQCTVRSNDFTVGNITRPPQNPLYKDITVPKDATISIEPITRVTGSYSLFATAVGGNSLQTNNNGKFTLPPILSDTAFYIELTVGDCSSARTRVNIKVVNETKIVVPNAFTPNNDGKNDTWGIRVIGIVKLNYIRVFNRWGQLIYETSNPDARWNGTLNGKSPLSATYAWS